MVKFLLNAPTALIQGVASQVHNMEGIHDRPRAGEFFGGGALKTSESIHRNVLNALTPLIGAGGQPGFEDLLGAARDHDQEPAGAVAIADGR
mgnify:CR=1 FL=1